MFRDPALGFVLLISGLAALALLGLAEDAAVEADPWAACTFAPEGTPLWPGALKTYSTRIPVSNFPELESIIKEARDMGGASAVDRFGLEKAERLVAVDAPDGTFVQLLDWGRIPKRGTTEVLAGVMTRLKEFEAGERRYTVVGGIRRKVGGLHFSYVFAYDESTDVVTREWTAGWLDRKGFERLRDVDPNSELMKNQRLIGGMHPADPIRAWGVVAALIVVVAGGTVIQLRLFTALSHQQTGPLAFGFEAIRDGRWGLVLLHTGGYALFFSAMAVGQANPVWQLYLQELVAHEFTEGGLGYVGDAYGSGNVPFAAGATFLNNYIVQTLGFTVAPSLIIPFFGVLKTALTFGMTGFVLAPVWAETASVYVYHSITMALELEAYLLATYGTCLYGVSLFRSARSNDWKYVIGGLKAMGSLALLAGVMLAVAGVYEAATLILFI